ncbi:hypothetical protein [Pediococcus argentinicus]|uniref:DNA-directed RNA polymerase beta subunit n=1 Tax=Pediococcus argentinicus TaxID=480391 RepID=A0A0R2NM40_9LACO|nr:hypothetical protein [Pediococcus argentinicus]KRO25101.1 hypothetical protein IV88_GL000434 [Pediococcus argentinicus]NKZ22555.1 hypothetical protein [Pediococcus argentinicus]GEP19607.1 hypothetical protein LSA03_09910 [Pediococcus argentinicus]
MSNQSYDPKKVQLFFNSYYKDRGVIKWQGYYLSDHTSALNKQAKEKAKRAAVIIPDQMSTSDISDCLQQAVIKRYPIHIQTNTKNKNGEFEPEFYGYIQGYDEDLLFLSSDIVIELDNIRSVNK